MVKKFFKNIFAKKAEPYTGQCKKINVDPDTYFFYFTENTAKEDDLDKFLGDYFDYDFYNDGIVIWPEPNNKVYIHKPYFFPYNTYIVKFMEIPEITLRCYSIDEFKKIYRIV